MLNFSLPSYTPLTRLYEHRTYPTQTPEHYIAAQLSSHNDKEHSVRRSALHKARPFCYK